MIYASNIENTQLTDAFEECNYEPGIEAAWGIVTESEANYNRIMQAIGIEELCAYTETGQELVYEAANVKGFIGKAKEFFMKMWEKIKGMFKKFFAMFDSYAKNDKEFVNKYKTHLLKVNTRNFEYKGFNFTNLDLSMSKVYNNAVKAAPMDVLNVKSVHTAPKKVDDRASAVEKMRGAAIGESSLEAGEYTKELFKLFRSGEDSKETLDNIDVSRVLSNISANSGLKKNAEKSYKELEKEFKETLKTLDKYEKELTKSANNAADGGAVRGVSDAISYLKEAINITQIANGAKLTAIKDCNRQSKAICVALMNYKPKNEGFSFGDDEDDVYNEGGFLSNVIIK